nr:uncharacterized protein LOC113398726 [Vanessa tameamea]
MKYLGLILDGRWSFGQHFVQLGPRLINAAAALGRILSNMGGPGSLCRRLYAGVVRSMALIARQEGSPSCHECGAPVDTTYNTLYECAAWRPQRHTMAATMGGDLSLPSVINAMLGSEMCWSEMSSFYKSVMSQKESAEREREEI